jgi:hypothetical protein
VELCTNRYAKLKIGNRGQKTELTEKSRRRRSTLVCRAIEEEKDEAEEEEAEEEQEEGEGDDE